MTWGLGKVLVPAVQAAGFLSEDRGGRMPEVFVLNKLHLIIIDIDPRWHFIVSFSLSFVFAP